MKMLRFGVLLVVLSCISDVTDGQTTAAPPDVALTIYECTKNEVSYSVLNGINGGKTFIEGSQRTTTNCPTALDGTVAQNFTMNYVECVVVPSELNNGTQLSFVVLVQKAENVNTIKDSRFKVLCTFSDLKTDISVTLKTTSSDPLSYQDKQFNTSPSPKMGLDFKTNDSAVGEGLVLLGTDLVLTIFLDPKIPEYDIIPELCTMNADSLSGIAVAKEVILVGGTGCSVINVFPNFTFSYISAFDSTNKPYDVPLLMAAFEAFTPTLLGEKLSISDVFIKITCTVRVCIRGGNDCTQPTCTTAKRRRRQANANSEANTTLFDLRQRFRVSFSGDSYDNASEEPTSVHIGESDICMERLAFWGALLSLLALLVAAWIALCCFFIFVRRRRRRECKTLVYEDDKTSTKESTLTPVEFNVVEKPMKTIPMILPRYHVADFAHETVETRKEFD